MWAYNGFLSRITENIVKKHLKGGHTDPDQIEFEVVMPKEILKIYTLNWTIFLVASVIISDVAQ